MNGALYAVVMVIAAANTEIPKAETVQVRSSLDGAMQPCLLVPAKGDKARPLLVGLHPWSHGYNTFKDMEQWQREAEKRGWHYLQPHFRGPNNNPDACASERAKQDILDAVDFAVGRVAVDTRRIYVAGVSGGAHMALVMAAQAPERWAAVTAWCPITDLVAWHDECRKADRKYWQDIEAACGGAPGASSAVDAEYVARSPLPHLSLARDLPVDINTGIHDGHTGSVPIHHAIDAFNVIARVRGSRLVSVETIRTLSEEKPVGRGARFDKAYGRGIYLRRHAGPTRVTVFEGGHEMIAPAACTWLADHRRRAIEQKS